MGEEASGKGMRATGARRAGIAAALLATLWFAMLTFGAAGADDNVLRALYAGDWPLVAGTARVLTFFGEGPVLLLITVAAGAWLLGRGHARTGLAMVAVTVVGRLLIDAQKYSIVRMRPGGEAHLVPVASPAFPSAHAGNSMIVYLALALVLTAGTRWNRSAAAFAVAFALLVGLSRIVLGVHWPSDVIGGWSFGLLWVLLAMPLADRLARPKG